MILVHLNFQVTSLGFEPLPIFFEHFLLGPKLNLLVVVLAQEFFTIAPKGHDIRHFHVEIEESSHELGVLALMFLVRIQGSQLKKEEKMKMMI